MSQLWTSSPTSPTAAASSGTAGAQESSRSRYPGRRFGQIVRLKPECVAQYKEVHAAVWPEVLKQIKDCNIQDCKSPPCTGSQLDSVRLTPLADSIFHDADTNILFASFKYVGYDYAGDMERMRENPKVREWWRMTDGMQESLVPGAKDSESGEPAWWRPVEEVFYYTP